jgi:virulence-associated protein VapD
MFAIAFDLTVAEVAERHPRGVTQAYNDIGNTLAAYGFDRKQGSVYVCDSEDLANLLSALNALKVLPWFPQSVRDIRAFRVEQWSDFTAFMKGN